MMAGEERRDEASDCAKCIYEAGKCDKTVSAGVEGNESGVWRRGL